MELTLREREWVNKKWAKVRNSQRRADAAGNDWNRINDDINRKHQNDDMRRMERGRPLLTDLMKVEAKSASLPLKDAFDTGKWHAAEAQRHIDDVMLFLKLKELGLL